MPTESEIRSRIYQVMPVTHQAFLKLLGLLEIRISREIDTAAVSLGAHSIMKINPDFIGKYCRRDEALMMLVLHEMMHILLGHTRLYELSTPARNIAFDAIINADLCRLFPRPEYTALFRNLYSETELPEALLRPPAGWGTREIHWRLEGRAGEIHRALYLDAAVTTSEVLDLLESEVQRATDENVFAQGKPVSAEDGAQEQGGPKDPVDRLLGSHDSKAEDEQPFPDVMKKIREIIARWPRESLLSGRDEGGDLVEETIRPRIPARQVIATLRRAILSVVASDRPSVAARRPNISERPSLQPWFSPSDRRAAVLEALGQPVLLWSEDVRDRRLSPVSRARIYLDVSGSMASILPLIYGALLPLREWIHPEIHVFSTIVRNISLADLGAGRAPSTGGTSISCVTGHIIRNRVRRALILSDGWVGEIPIHHLSQLRGLRSAAVLTKGGDSSFARKLGSRIFELPQLSGEN